MRLLLSILALSISVPVLAEPPKTGYRVLAQDKGKVAIVGADGKVEWEVECKYNSHDIHLLPNGNLLLHTADATVTEMTPKKEVVWKYTAKPKEGYKGGIEIHSFQRLADGNTMIAESGNRRIVEVDKDGKIVKEVPLTVNKPDPHRDTRMVRKLESGNYLVCHEGDGCVREYDEKGKVVWTYTLDLGGRARAGPRSGRSRHGGLRSHSPDEWQHRHRRRQQQPRAGSEQGRQGGLEH